MVPLAVPFVILLQWQNESYTCSTRTGSTFVTLYDYCFYFLVKFKSLPKGPVSLRILLHTGPGYCCPFQDTESFKPCEMSRLPLSWEGPLYGYYRCSVANGCHKVVSFTRRIVIVGGRSSRVTSFPSLCPLFWGLETLLCLGPSVSDRDGESSPLRPVHKVNQGCVDRWLPSNGRSMVRDLYVPT